MEVGRRECEREMEELVTVAKAQPVEDLFQCAKEAFPLLLSSSLVFLFYFERKWRTVLFMLLQNQ